MRVTPDPDANLRAVTSAIQTAAEAGARMVVFPECALSGYPPLHYSGPGEINLGLISELNERVRSAAAEAGVWVIVGSIGQGVGKFLNTALVISSDGELVGRYDKMHLMPDDKRFFESGGELRTMGAGDMVFGVQICYDARFPEGFRYLRERGARLIAVLSNACGGETWKAPVLEGTYRARASENTCFIVAVNAAGPLQMATSRICNPLGLDLASANQDREEMIFADIDLRETEAGYFHDRRTDLFELRGRFG